MLASTEIVDVVARCLEEHGFPTCVIDPVCSASYLCTLPHHLILFRQVMVSTTGHRLLPSDAVSSFRTKLLHHATVLTPNIPEATLLLEDAGEPISELKDISDVVRCAQAVQRLGPRFVLLKGGHMPMTHELKIATQDSEKHLAVNVVVGDDVIYELSESWSTSNNTHGTGCSLACMLQKLGALTSQARISDGICSCSCVQPRPWLPNERSNQQGLSLRQCRNSALCFTRERKWSHKSLSFVLYASILPVRPTQLLNTMRFRADET